MRGKKAKAFRRVAGLVVLCAGLFAAVPSSAGATPSHPFLFQVTAFTPEPNVTEYFEAPCGLTVDKDGSFYVSDYYHDRVDVFSSAGSLLTQIKDVEPLDGPCGLAVTSVGQLFANVFHRNLTRFTPAAFPIASKTAYGAGTVIDEEHPTGVAVDPVSGNLYLNERTHVAVYEPSGAVVEEAGQPLAIGDFGDGYGIAVSAFPATAGFIYVADAADNTIEVYDPATDKENPIEVIDGAGTPQGGFTTLRDAALAIDQQTGHLFVSYNSQGPFYEHPKAAVAEFNAAGEYRGTLPAPTPLWFGEPSGIAVDNSATATQGRVYVSTGNSQVESAGLKPEKAEEGALYAFGPSVPGFGLQASLTGAGSGEVKSTPAGISCPPACGAEYDEGALVKLSATPSSGSAFAGWSGDCAGAGACQVTISAAKAVVAEFVVAPPPGALGGGGEGADSGAAPEAPSALESAPQAQPGAQPGPLNQSAAQRAERRRVKAKRGRAGQRRRMKQRRAKLRQRQQRHRALPRKS